MGRIAERVLSVNTAASTANFAEDELFSLVREQETEHALVLLDARQRVVAWRGAATTMFGYSVDEMRGGTIDRLFTPEDRERGEVANEFSTAVSYGRADDHRWMVRKDNLRIWASGALTVLKTKDGCIGGFSKIFRDRTEVCSHLDTLRSRLEAALQAEHRKTSLLGPSSMSFGIRWALWRMRLT